MKEDINELFTRTIPRWVQVVIYGVLISLVSTIFVLIANSWLYASENYATKRELQELKVDLKERMDRGFSRVLDAIKDKK